MADNKQWFKVWTSILTDPQLASLHNQTVGCWVRLCALTAQHGTGGILKITAQQLIVTLHLLKASQNDINKIFNDLKKLNILINEEVQKESVTLVTLQFLNWQKYQAYSESYERVNKFRKRKSERYTCNVEKKRREEKRREKKRKENPPIIPPNWVDNEALNAFKEMRKSLRKPLTEKAESLLYQKLESLKNQGEDICAVLNQSTMNCWQGVFPVKREIEQKRSWEKP